MLAQHLHGFRVTEYIGAGSLFAQRRHADHVNAPTLGGDIEASHEQDSPATYGLQPELGHLQPCTLCELEAGRLETDDVMRVIARATRELGKPLARVVMDQ